jgi:hypothetical protein
MPGVIEENRENISRDYRAASRTKEMRCLPQLHVAWYPMRKHDYELDWKETIMI